MTDKTKRPMQDALEAKAIEYIQKNGLLSFLENSWRFFQDAHFASLKDTMGIAPKDAPSESQRLVLLQKLMRETSGSTFNSTCPTTNLSNAAARMALVKLADDEWETSMQLNELADKARAADKAKA